MARKWRSITRAQIEVTAENREQLVQYVSGKLKSVLVVAGWPNERPIGQVGISFSNAVSTIVELSLRINTAIGQEITSMDIQPIEVLPQSKYNPATMDDIFARNRKLVRTTTCVVVVTGMGLQLECDKAEAGSKILLKTKVVLESGFGEVVS